MTPRESIVAKAQAGGAHTLTGEEMAELLKMEYALGRLEAGAIKHQREVDALNAQIAERDGQINSIQQFMARESRKLWDSFAAAALSCGDAPEIAASKAQQMMALREGRRA